VSASESPLPTSRTLSRNGLRSDAWLCALLHGSRESVQLSRSLLEQIIGSRQACSEAAGSGVPVAPWVKIHTQKILFHTLKNNFIPSKNENFFHTLIQKFHILKFFFIPLYKISYLAKIFLIPSKNNFIP
jgi:hypothetical protein